MHEKLEESIGTRENNQNKYVFIPDLSSTRPAPPFLQTTIIHAIYPFSNLIGNISFSCNGKRKLIKKSHSRLEEDNVSRVRSELQKEFWWKAMARYFHMTGLKNETDAEFAGGSRKKCQGKESHLLGILPTKKHLAQDQKSGLFHLHYLKTFIIYSLGDLMIFNFPDHYFFCNKPFFLSPSSPALFIYLFIILNVLISHCYVVFNQHLCVVQFRVD